MVMSDGTPFKLQYNSLSSQAVRDGKPASDGSDLRQDPPPFDPRKLQSSFIKSGTNPLKTGFNSQQFDPKTVQGLIDKAGTTPNFGNAGNTFDPGDEVNKAGKEFLTKYQEGVQRGLVQDPVNQANLAPFMSRPAPYQNGEGLTNVSQPFPGSSGTKIG
jgi:hypothetical protein